MKLPADSPALIFIGPLPPPVHGQSVATQALLDLVTDAGVQVHVIDNGPGIRGRLFRRLFREAKAMITVTLARAPAVYASVNSNSGVIATILLCLLARLRRKKIVLHHHSYRWIGQTCFLMALLVRVSGSAAVHVVNCPEMGRLLRARYPRAIRTMSYSNAGVVDHRLRPTPRGPSEPVIGHMSNLTREKGLGRVIEAFRQVLRCWPAAQLHLAGPYGEIAAERLVAQASVEFGEAFRYFGAVYGEEKQSFFDGIDVFAFPSLYPVETQGIVNLEAMACGKPVVAFAQCCIPGDIGTDGGLAVSPSADFSQALVDYLKICLRDRAETSWRARQQFELILQNHTAERDELLKYLSEITRGS